MTGDRCLRVLLVGLNASYGGAERHMLDLAAGLRKRDHRVTMAVPRGSEIAAQARRTDPQDVIEIPRGPGAVPAIIRQVNALRPRILHMHSPRASVLGRLAARALPRDRRAGMAVLSTAHGWIPQRLRLYRWIEQVYDRTAAWEDGAIAVAGTVAATLEEHGYPNPIWIVPNGLDREWGKGLVGRAWNGDAALEIGYFGRLAEEKGLPVLVEALRGLDRHDWHLHVYGDGHARAVVERGIVAARILDRVTLHGNLTPALVAERMCACHVIVIPSLQEGHPYVAIEAARLAVPIVACRVGGLAEVVRDQENGLLVPPRDPAALTEALRRIVTEPGLLARLRLAALTRREAYSAEDMTDLVVEAYRRSLSVPRFPAGSIAAPGANSGAR